MYKRQLYMRTLGNRPDLFGNAQYPNASTIKQPTYYDIPPEALKEMCIRDRDGKAWTARLSHVVYRMTPTTLERPTSTRTG